jgi:hypothetical protein
MVEHLVSGARWLDEVVRGRGAAKGGHGEAAG